MIAFVDSDVILSEHLTKFLNTAEFSPDEFLSRTLTINCLLKQLNLSPTAAATELGREKEAYTLDCSLNYTLSLG